MRCIKEELIAGNNKKRRVKLISDTIPLSLNITGADVENLDSDITFAPGSYLMCLENCSIYVKGEEGAFVKWEVM